MKILFLGQNLTQKKDLSIEGLVTIVQKLENHFNKKHTIFINNTKKLKESNIINLHSSGFSEILNYKKKINKIIYCIHSDIKSYFRYWFDQKDIEVPEVGFYHSDDYRTLRLDGVLFCPTSSD